MIFSILKRKGNSIFPIVVPALNALFTLALIFFFEEGIYSNYVYLTSSITVTFLLSNMGVRLSLVKQNDCESNYDAIKKIRKVLVVFILMVLLSATIYSTMTNENHTSLLVFGALNLLLMDAFLSFNNSKGRIAEGYLRFAIGPRLAFFSIFLVMTYSGLSLERVYFFCILISLFVMSASILHESKNSPDKAEDRPLPYSKPFRMFAEWSQIALYGLFTPSLIVYAEHFDSGMVKVLGIVLMIGQPFSILYQGSIALNLKKLKEIAVSAGSSNIDTKAYQLVTKFGVLGVALHILIVIIGYSVFSEANLKNLFQSSHTVVGLLIFSTLYVNAIFGPNGTVLGLMGRSYFDAYVALSKIICVVFVALTSSSIQLMLFIALMAELIGNIVKNLYLSRLINANQFFTLKPMLLSSSILVLNSYVCF